MAYQPIENYAIIGNMRSAALVGLHGSIDWFCFPHFDSPSVFAALLDDRKGGYFRIFPELEKSKSKQYYWPDTNVLITRFYNDQGIVELTDQAPSTGSFTGLRKKGTWPGCPNRGTGGW